MAVLVTTDMGRFRALDSVELLFAIGQRLDGGGLVWPRVYLPQPDRLPLWGGIPTSRRQRAKLRLVCRAEGLAKTDLRPGDSETVIRNHVTWCRIVPLSWADSSSTFASPVVIPGRSKLGNRGVCCPDWCAAARRVIQLLVVSNSAE